MRAALGLSHRDVLSFSYGEGAFSAYKRIHYLSYFDRGGLIVHEVKQLLKAFYSLL